MFEADSSLRALQLILAIGDDGVNPTFGTWKILSWMIPLPIA